MTNEAKDMPDSPGWYAFEGLPKGKKSGKLIQTVFYVYGAVEHLMAQSVSDSKWPVEHLVGKWTRVYMPWESQPTAMDMHIAATAALGWIDEIYPPDIFDGSSGDEGPVRIVGIRENLRKALQRALQEETK